MAVLLALLGIALYATQNVIMSAYLQKYSAAAVVLLFYVATAPLAGLALLAMRASGQHIVWPSGWHLLTTFAAGAAFFFADYAYVSAYTSAKGNLYAVTVCAALMPVFSVLFAAALGHKLPNPTQLAGIALAIVAVALVARGS